MEQEFQGKLIAQISADYLTVKLFSAGQFPDKIRNR